GKNPCAAPPRRIATLPCGKHGGGGTKKPLPWERREVHQADPCLSHLSGFPAGFGTVPPRLAMRWGFLLLGFRSRSAAEPELRPNSAFDPGLARQRFANERGGCRASSGQSLRHSR